LHIEITLPILGKVVGLSVSSTFGQFDMVTSTYGHFDVNFDFPGERSLSCIQIQNGHDHHHVWRHVQELGLQSAYHKNSEFNRYCRQLLALSCLL